MTSIPITSVAYLKENITEVLADITRSREPLIITRNGEAACVMQDIKSWEQQQQTMALLKILALGKQQIARGEVHRAEEVLAGLEADDVAALPN